jgi:hypothetical protein
MADASRSELPQRVAVGAVETWRRLNTEQRVAAVASVLLIVSTFGPFSFVEAATVLVAIGVLVLLRKRAEGHQFHIPFGDGAVIAAAGAWSAVLIVIRLFDRPLGQNLLALVCAAALVLAGLREHAKRPADDVPPEAAPPRPRRTRPPPPPDRLGPDKVETEALFEPPEWPAADKPTERLPPPRPPRDDEPGPG